MNTKTYSKILLILIIVTIAFIWINSMLPGSASTNESGFVMNLARPFLEIFVGKGNVTMYLVRKLAHFTEYFVLGAELTLYIYIRFMNPHTAKRWLSVLIPLAAGLIIASIDETIQIFSINRGPSVKDVLLDFTGVCTAFVIVRGIIFIIEKSKDNIRYTRN